MDKELIKTLLDKLGKFFWSALFLTAGSIFALYYLQFIDLFELFETKAGTAKAFTIIIFILCGFVLLLMLIEKLINFLKETVYYKNNRLKKNAIQNLNQIINGKRQVGDEVSKMFSEEFYILSLLINNNMKIFSLEGLEKQVKEAQTIAISKSSMYQLSKQIHESMNSTPFELNKIDTPKTLNALLNKGIIDFKDKQYSFYDYIWSELNLIKDKGLI